MLAYHFHHCRGNTLTASCAMWGCCPRWFSPRCRSSWLLWSSEPQVSEHWRPLSSSMAILQGRVLVWTMWWRHLEHSCRYSHNAAETNMTWRLLVANVCFTRWLASCMT